MKKIVLLGGNGYLGRNLQGYLANEDFDVTCVVRKLPENRYDKFKYVICDIRDRQQLANAFIGAELVVNLAAVVKSVNKQNYHDNVIMAQNIVAAMKESNVNNLLHISTQNVYLKNKGAYSKSKLESEKIITNSGLSFMILRPNYIYGIDKENYLYNMAKMISKFHFAVTISNGRNFFQPILKDDLSRIIIDQIKAFKPNTSIDVSGGDTVSVNLIITKISNRLKYRTFKLRIPVFFLKPFAYLLPFDLKGFTEDRFAKKNYKFNYTPFDDSLDKITQLILKD